MKYWSRMNELTCFNWKYLEKKTRKLSKNDKFVTNKTKTCLFCHSFVFFMKLRQNTQIVVFISHVILSETSWVSRKKIKWYSTKKRWKSHIEANATKQFSPVLRLLLFSVIPTFEESLCINMYIFDRIPCVSNYNL